ncbi:MAG: hypothetical protein ABR988_09785 [Terriglobales bacterium]
MTIKTAAVPDFSAARVAGIAVLVSLFSFLYYVRHSDLLLYGDAIAHINIARRVFDSETPGLLQLGRVWLPLPHLLLIPFIWSNAMWQNGTGGSIPSMIAYVFGVVGIFRLVRGMLQADLSKGAGKEAGAKPAASVGAWAAAFAYGANPNLIYMQATAMTESVYLALFIWAVVYFAEFLRALKERALKENNRRKNEHTDEPESGPDGRESGPGERASSPGGANQLSPALHRGVGQEELSKSRRDDPVLAHTLTRCAWCLAGAELTRYDGWFLAGVTGTAVAVIALRSWQNRTLRRVAAKFLLGIAVVPVLWLVYNGAVYGNALDFANGPYSAKAIEQRVGAPNPALHHAGVAAIYFLKSAQLNLANGNWGRFWLAAAFVALVIAAWKLRAQSASLLLLWVPLVFYSFSIAYGSVPLHVYTWWPFATFNQRYGLQLLPMFAVSTGVLAASVFLLGAGGRHKGKAVAVILALVLGSYASVWKAEPQCLAEARRNWAIRNPLNSAVQRVLARLPRNSRFLMDISEHVGVMEQAGIPLRQVVNNENHRVWKRPSDPEGLWERALADPPRYLDFVIAFDGDAVDQGANLTNLTELIEIHATGQPHARIYAARSAPNQSR